MKTKKLQNVDVDLKLSVTMRILYYFFAYPQHAIGLNDLSQAVMAAKTTTKDVVLELIKDGFLQKEEIGKAWLIKATTNHIYTRKYKIPLNLQLVYDSNIVEAVYQVVPHAKCIILFGSYRWGDDNEKSDIDIAVEVINDQQPSTHNLGNIAVLGYRKNVPVNLHLFTRNNINLNLFANIANGIVLDGFLEVRP